MARSYSIAAVAFAIAAEPKWVDNLIARHDVPGVDKRGRGLELRVSAPALLLIAATRRLVLDLGIPVAVALPLASRLVADPDGAARIGTALDVRLDRRSLERDVAARLVEAAEAIAPRRRGRPPRHRPSAAGA
jgi:hypothetical protein